MFLNTHVDQVMTHVDQVMYGWIVGYEVSVICLNCGDVIPLLCSLQR